jgi:TPR repeat protein
MKSWKIILLTALVVCGANIAKADTFEEAMRAAGQGAYTKAFRLMSVAAERGSAEAKFQLANFYAKGLGVQQNIQESLRLYRESADMGYAVAQYDMGVISRRGYGVPRSDTEALRWYRLAASQGYLPAMNNLGFLYASNSPTVPTNLVNAYMWIYIASEKGYADAMKNIKLIETHLTKQQIEQATKKAKICVENKYKKCD